jgi:transcriptional regulator with XRE-family HTH domain
MSRLKELREQEGWTQDQLVLEMEQAGHALGVRRLPGRGSLKTSLSRWENGRVTPGPDYLRIFRRVFAASDVDLGFADDSEEWALPALRADGQIAYFEALFVEHVTADNSLGSAYVGPVVADQARQLLTLASQARGPTRRPLVALAAKYSEFLGWLNQDSGRLEAAMRHTDAARDLALELNDGTFNAYLLMRKSNIASDAGQGPLSLSLAEGAFSASESIPTDVRAVILRQKANAHALLGEAEECNGAIQTALDVLTEADRSHAQWAPYCTPEYVAMEAGNCWVLLGEHDRAVTSLVLAKDADRVTSKRDRGLALARAAYAFALADDHGAACATAILAIEAARAAPSGRVMRELRRLRGALRKRWPKDDQARAIMGAIGRLASEG